MNEPLFEIKRIKSTADYGKFEITPLERGYGMTLGNSLRRVMLMSLPGVAITTVRISRVKHQYSTLKGMKEDVVELLLNFKKVRFSYDTEDIQKVKLSAKGPGEVKAKDLELPPTLKVVNPELVLAHLTKDSSMSADIEVEFGVGYSVADDRETTRSVGLIPLDASFSPIVRVDYKVEETRVGRLTNFDKLIIEVWTDSTLKPKDAITEAAKILMAYFGQIVSPKKVEKVEEEEEEDTLGPVGKLSVEEIGLPTRVANALVKAGINTVEDLASADKAELIKVRNLGEKSLKIISVALAEKGVKFETD